MPATQHGAAAAPLGGVSWAAAEVADYLASKGLPVSYGQADAAARLTLLGGDDTEETFGPPLKAGKSRAPASAEAAGGNAEAPLPQPIRDDRQVPAPTPAATAAPIAVQRQGPAVAAPPSQVPVTTKGARLTGLRDEGRRFDGGADDRDIPHIAQHRQIITEVTFRNSWDLTDEGLRALAGCEQLQQLRFCDCEKLTGAGLRFVVDGCRQLESVTFERCLKLTDAGMRSLADCCPQLKSVYVNCLAKLSDEGLRALAGGCQQLQKVTFLSSSPDNFSDAGLRFLAARCSQLQSVRFEYCGNLTDAGVQALVDGCKQLQSVDLSYCKKLTDASLRALAGGCKQVRSVTWWGSSANFTDAGVRALAEGCEQLEIVNFSPCQRMTDASLRSLAGCKQLQKVYYEDCASLTDAGLRSLVDGCKQLKWVHFRECANLTDAGLLYLADGCKQLEWLKFPKCDKVTDAGLRALPNSFVQQLTVVNFHGCRYVTDDGRYLVKVNPSISYL